MRKLCQNKHVFQANSASSISYSVFFAAFDMTRRAGLRVKALFGGAIQTEWSGFLSINPSHPARGTSEDASPASTPTIARIAQAGTIVAGGITDAYSDGDHGWAALLGTIEFLALMTYIRLSLWWVYDINI